MLQLTAQLVRSYKGAAASIILLFLIERRALSQGYLRRFTGYPDEAISDACALLRDSGLLVQTGRYEWGLLSDGLRQLPIGAVPEALPPATVDKDVDNSVDNSRFIHSPEISCLEIGSTGADFEAAKAHACMQDSDSYDSEEEIHACMLKGPGADKSAAAELAAAVDAAGFREPGRGRLLRQAGLTARAVRYHVGTAPKLGAALYRLEHGWRVPEDFEPDPRKYWGGKYAEFIEH